MPQIGLGGQQVIEFIPYPGFTHRLTDELIMGYVDGLEAIQQTVLHILSTERFAYPIYGDNYGMEIEKYIGKSMSYVKSVIPQDIKEALTQDDRILDAIVTEMEELSKKALKIKILVITNIGNFIQEWVANA